MRLCIVDVNKITELDSKRDGVLVVVFQKNPHCSLYEIKKGWVSKISNLRL